MTTPRLSPTRIAEPVAWRRRSRLDGRWIIYTDRETAMEASGRTCESVEALYTGELLADARAALVAKDAEIAALKAEQTDGAAASVPAPSVDGRSESISIIDKAVRFMPQQRTWDKELVFVLDYYQARENARSPLPDAGAGTQGTKSETDKHTEALRKAYGDDWARVLWEAVNGAPTALSSHQTEARDDEAR